MDKETLYKILNFGESDTIDYKRTSYFSTKINSTKKEKDADYLKDIISIGNTVRDKSAYILLGVDEVNGKGKIVGLDEDEIFDDEIFQQKLKDKLSPVPKIKIHNITDKDSRIQIIEIPIVKYNRPIFSTVNIGNKLLKNRVYIRRGTSNGEALYDETIKLRDWLDNLPSFVELLSKPNIVEEKPFYEVAIYDNFQSFNITLGGQMPVGNIKFYIRSIFHRKSASGINSFHKNYLFDNFHNFIESNTMQLDGITCKIKNEEFWGSYFGTVNSVILLTHITDRLGQVKELRFSNRKHEGEGISNMVKYLGKLNRLDTHNAVEILDKKDKEIQSLVEKIEKLK